MSLALCVLTLTIVAVIIVLPNNASASQISDDIGIVLGNTCVTMIKNNVTSDCPTYDMLMSVYPDESNKRFSGVFDHVDGMYQRVNVTQHHLGIYQYDEPKKRIWIDPPGDVLSKINIIRIEPSIPQYKITGQNTISYNSTGAELVVGDSRHINNSCSKSVISAKSWLLLLGDTMNIVLNGCDKSLSLFSETKTKFFEKSEQDITTSYKYNLDKWYEEAKKLSKQYLIPR